MSTAKDDDSKLSQSFNPGRTGRRTEAELKTEASLKAVAAFKSGYAAAFDGLLHTDDLALLLSNFASMLQRKAKPTEDHWFTEAKLFVSQTDASPHLARWFQDWGAPQVSDPSMTMWETPSLNTAACDFLNQEDWEAEEVERAKEAEV